MTKVDVINGLWALGAAFVNFLNVRKLLQDKAIRGVHWGTTAFFMCLGFWNLIAYPALHLPFSFVCEIAVVSMNMAWLGLAIYYWRQDANALSRATG